MYSGNLYNSLHNVQCSDHLTDGLDIMKLFDLQV